MKGQEIVSGELSAEVSPVVVLEDNAAEWQFLQKVRLCTSVMVQPAVAAQNTLFRLRNPAGSGIIGVVGKLSFAATVSGMALNLGYANTLTSLATAGSTAMRDGRWGKPTNPTALIASRANNVAINLQSSLWVTFTLASTLNVYPHGRFIVLPGETIEWGTGTLNISIGTTVDWTERELPVLER